MVGGGPVGLVTALLLAREGVATALLEKTAEIETDLRASTFHPPTLDFLDDIGLADALIAQGLISPQWQVRLHPEGDGDGAEVVGTHESLMQATRNTAGA